MIKFYWRCRQRKMREQLRILLESLSRVITDGLVCVESVESLAVVAERVHRLLVVLVQSVPDIESSIPQIELVINCFFHQNMADQLQHFRTPVFVLGKEVDQELRFPGMQLSTWFAIGFLSIKLHSYSKYIQVLWDVVWISLGYQLEVLTVQSMIMSLTELFQNCSIDTGYRLIKGYLAAMGHRLQEARIRNSLQQVDPIGVMTRWIHRLQRRRYSVSRPNMLWHIDGNHKLIRW